jgi:hypothetical protein
MGGKELPLHPAHIGEVISSHGPYPFIRKSLSLCIVTIYQYGVKKMYFIAQDFQFFRCVLKGGRKHKGLQQYGMNKGQFNPKIYKGER